MPTGLKTLDSLDAGQYVFATTLVTGTLFSSVKKKATGRGEPHPAVPETIADKKQASSKCQVKPLGCFSLRFSHGNNLFAFIVMEPLYNTRRVLRDFFAFLCGKNLPLSKTPKLPEAKATNSQYSAANNQWRMLDGVACGA